MRRPPLGRLGLPVLPNIYVASPCPADWSKMTGDERARMCGQCNKHVFNLSQMTRSDAEELIIEKNGSLCVRYYQRNDGTILLKDCTVAASAARRKQMLGVAAAALLATGTSFAMLTAQRGTPPEAARIITPPPAPDLEFRIHEEELQKNDPPPIVIAPPPPTVEELLMQKEDWHVTGGAVAISPDEYLEVTK
ncbi:MAG TPA: hypothetical protein VL326_05735 [Kofleriaceae bacterium]|jgi:hypothetical protein|nr:hypothetical protein [Kofleriaceae bacterium]